jgi:hypothetical protein
VPGQLVTLSDRGHAPILAADELIGRIAKFIAGCEARIHSGRALPDAAGQVP